MSGGGAGSRFLLGLFLVITPTPGSLVVVVESSPLLVVACACIGSDLRLRHVSPENTTGEL